MSFLPSLPYEGQKQGLMIELLSKFSGSPVDEVLLEKRLISGNCMFYDSDVRLLGSSLRYADTDVAKYLIIDSGLSDIRSNTGINLGISVTRYDGKWKSGYVGPIDKLQQNIRKPADTQQANDEIQAQKAMHVQKLIVPDKYLSEICSLIIKPNTSWTSDEVRKCLCQMTFFIRALLECGMSDEKLSNAGVLKTEHNGKPYILFNSGFMAISYKPMYVYGEVLTVSRSNGDKSIAVNNVRMITPEVMREMGFSGTPLKLGGAKMDIIPEFEHFSTEDAWHFFHVLRARSERLPESAQRLAFQHSIRRLYDSVELALSLEASFGGFIAPFLHNKSGDVQYFLPLYLQEDPDLTKPDAALVVGFNDGGKTFSARTIFTIDDASRKAKVTARYKTFPWLDLTLNVDDE